jgi:hypothetical protein
MGDFEKDDLLLTFKQQPQNMVTIWNSFSPLLPRIGRTERFGFGFQEKTNANSCSQN